MALVTKTFFLDVIKLFDCKLLVILLIKQLVWFMTQYLLNPGYGPIHKLDYEIWIMCC